MRCAIRLFTFLGQLAVFGFSISGCNANRQPPLADVQGEVILDGQPLANATVLFQPNEGRASVGHTNEQGHFELVYLPGTPGAQVGKHTIVITTANENTPEERVPPQYNVASKLTHDVQPDENYVPLHLKSDQEASP